MPVKPQSATGRAATDGVVEVINPSGDGRFVLVCEHASNFIPAELNDLGLDGDALASHVAWDPGALAVAREMSLKLDAPLVAQRVSRLVYDCNRPPEAPSAMAPVSETWTIPGNADLTAAGRRERTERFYLPFRDALRGCIDRKMQGSHAPVLVTVHSFTPVYHGLKRDLDLGILHDSDARFADALIEACASDRDLVIRRNAPYGPQDGVMHTVREHAIPRNLLNVMIEIRNDLIADVPSQQAMGARLSARVAEALAVLADGTERREGEASPAAARAEERPTQMKSRACRGR